MKKLLLCLAILGCVSTPLFAQEEVDAEAAKAALAEQKAAEKAALAEQKAAEKAALAEQKAAEKAIKDAEKAEQKAIRDAEKQAKAEQKAAEKQAKKDAKEANYDMDVNYQPHSNGVSYRLGAMGEVGSQTLSFDFYTRERKGASKYSPLVSLRFNIPFTTDHVGQLGGADSWGFLFGGSQYVFDIRNEDSLGWSMLVNGGVTWEFPTVLAVNEISDILRHPFTLGTEIEFKAIYNFHKYVGATFGFTLGYAISPDFEYMISEDRSADNSGFDCEFAWSFSMGFVF